MGTAVLRSLLALVALSVLPMAAIAKEIRVAPNIFLVKDRSGSPLSFQMIVHAGCWDEANGQCLGLAHYLEHLILVGRNPEHKDAVVRMFDTGNANGWTNQRATAYTHSVPAKPDGAKADLERLFTFYAARLENFNIAEDEAIRERNVVLQEHDLRVGSKPLVLFMRDQQRMLIPNHVAGQWTVGTKDSINALTLDQARAFHKNWYSINNVNFVIKGDLEEADVKAIAEKALAGAKARPLPDRNFVKPIETTVGRQDLRRKHANVKQPHVNYRKLIRLPEGDAVQQRAARTMLMNFLTSQLPGSLHHALTEVNLLATGRPGVSLERVAPDTYQLSVSAESAPDVGPDELLKAIETWVGGLKADTLSAETLARLQKRMANGRETADKDPAQVYNRLVGWLASRQLYEDLEAWPARLAAATTADVAPIIQAIAGPGKVLTGIMEPEATK